MKSKIMLILVPVLLLAYCLISGSGMARKIFSFFPGPGFDFTRAGRKRGGAKCSAAADRLEEVNLVGMPDQGIDIGGGQKFVFPDPQDQGRTAAGEDDLSRRIAVEEGDPKGALDHPQGLLHRRRQIAPVTLLDHMDQNLGIGLGFKGMAFFQQLFLEREIILDNPIVNQKYLAISGSLKSDLLPQSILKGC